MHDLIESLDVKMMTSVQNAETKLMDRLSNSHKEQSTKWDNLRIYQELKLKDIINKITNINETVDNDLITRK